MIVLESFVKTSPSGFVQFGTANDMTGDLDLVEGAIEIKVDDVSLLGMRNWDYVFPLWMYIAAALSDFRTAGEGSLRFPDQPVGLELIRTMEGVLLRVSGDGPDREVVASESEFVQAVRARGVEFFSSAISRFPEERSSIERGMDRLLADPPDRVLSDIRWEERLDKKQVAAFNHVERVSRYNFSPQERERILLNMAGKGGVFEDYVILIREDIQP